MSKFHLPQATSLPHDATLRSGEMKFIRLDLLTEIKEPLILQDKVIGMMELEALANTIDGAVPLRGRAHPADLLLLNIATDLRTGNLSLFSREIELNPKIFKRYPRVQRGIENIFGAIDSLATKLLLVADYDQRILNNQPEYLAAIAKELKARNFAYCRQHLPHLIESQGQGLHCIAKLTSDLENGDLRSAIIMRLNEADKMRNKGPVTAYVQEIFGNGFRLARVWEKRSSTSK